MLGGERVQTSENQIFIVLGTDLMQLTVIRNQ